MNALRIRDEGSTMVAVVLVLFVGTVIGVAAVQMAQHTNDATTVDRLRIQAVHAAEAGVNDAFDRLGGNAGCDLTPTPAKTLKGGADGVGVYRYQVDPEAGTLCGETDKRVIHSWGFGPQQSTKGMRHVEVSVQLIPQEGFRFTLFASGPTGIVAVKNTGTIQGDVYAENLDQTQNNVNAEDVITPGSIDTKDNAVYTGTLWAGGNVTLRQNGNVTQSILAAGSSAAGDVVLENNVNIGKDVKAAGTIHYPTNYAIGGTASENNPNVPAPPSLDKPTFSYDSSNYSPTPTEFGTTSALTTHLESIKDDLKGTFYVNQPAEPQNAVKLPRDGKVTGPLTIISTNRIEVGRSLESVGGPWQVVLVSLSSNESAIDVPQPFSGSPSLDILMYATGGVNFKNATTFTGAVYADTITLKNKVTVHRSESLASNPPAGFDFTQSSAFRFTVVPILWKEIVPGLPPD